MVQNCKNLNELWDYVYALNKSYYPDHNLMPIVGNGKCEKPRFMFVFINPTIRNISSDQNWQGPRFPFIGTKNIWRILHRAGLFNDKLINEINNNPYWSLEFTNQVLNLLKDKSFYFTNIVKWTGNDAALPDSKKVELFLPILKREIEIVQPKYIITFGIIPFERLTKQKIKLNEYYSKVIKNNKLYFYEVKINSFKTKIIPCYFPVGRGHPKEAIEILKLTDSL